MTQLTDGLVRERLAATPENLNAFHYDAHFRAEWTMFSQALDRAHQALLHTGEPEADQIATALSLGLPDPLAAGARIEDEKRRADQLMRGEKP